jgi:hypothetical protein
MVDIFSSTTVVGIAPYPDVGSYMDGVIRNDKATVDEPKSYATDLHLQRYQTTMSDLFTAGVDHIIAEYDLHSQENISSLDFYVQMARIQRAKLDFLVGFRTELQELGILERN